MLSSQKRSRQGFSLLEVMVALAILSLAVSTLLVIRNNSIEKAGRSRSLRKTRILLEQKMGEIAMGIEKRTSGSFTEAGYENYVWSAEIREIRQRSAVDVEGKIHEVAMKKVTVTVRHKASENKSEQKLEAYFLKENPEDAIEVKKQSEKPEKP